MLWAVRPRHIIRPSVLVGGFLSIYLSRLRCSTCLTVWDFWRDSRTSHSPEPNALNSQIYSLGTRDEPAVRAASHGTSHRGGCGSHQNPEDSRRIQASPHALSRKYSPP